MTPIRTLQDIRLRCRCDAGCWLWQQAVTRGELPIAKVDGRCVTLRRWVYAQQHGPLPAGHRLLTSCKEPRCLAPGHLVATAETVVRRKVWETMGRTAHYGTWLAGRQKWGTKLDMDKARAIRADERSSTVLALVYGVSPEMIRRVRAGKVWHEGAPGASVFTWRPAA